MLAVGKKIAIYRINTSHRMYGEGWGSYSVAARTCEEAIRMAKREFISGERVESVNLLASNR